MSLDMNEVVASSEQWTKKLDEIENKIVGAIERSLSRPPANRFMVGASGALHRW